MRSRRNVLATLGAASIAGLAGCSALPFGEDQGGETNDVSLTADAVEPITWPDSPFPVPVPSTLADTHDDRAREVLAAVPNDPSVPNSAIAEDLRSDRERAADRLEGDVDGPWPTQHLSEWRARRHMAATVRGAYRAATGESDVESVTERQRAAREKLYSFVADHEYRASSPLEAVLAHTPIETLVADCRRRIRPAPAYPADPVADPFLAGDAVGRIELAHAMLGDARRLRDVYLTERSDASSQWASLIDTSNHLRLAVGRTRSTVQDVLQRDDPPFDTDLDGTAGRRLYDVASRQVESMSEEHEELRDEGDYATAVIEAGRTLAAIEALEATVDGIRDDAYQNEVTAESVTRMAERAQDALATIDPIEDTGLATQICRPALEIVDSLPAQIEEGYADAARVQGELAWAELYARAVPAATGFVIDRLR